MNLFISSNAPFNNKNEERRAILRNVFLISLGFTLLFTAYNSMSALQSSINKVDGLGTASLTSVYVALMLSCMFLPSIMIKRLTTKWTMCVCMLCYSTYIAAQFYPEFYTLIPTALILGLAAAPMWSAKCKYLTQVGTRYAEITGQDPEHLIVRFFGIFFLLFQSSSVWGNIISSTVLRPENATEAGEVDLSLCGANYDPSNPPTNATNDNFAIETWQIYTLASVYLVSSILGALLVAVAVDPLKRFNIPDEDEGGVTGTRLLIATFKHLKNKKQILIVPLTMWSGFEQGFFGADFTAGYVSCSWGVSNVGYVLICYGVCDAICSLSFGPLMKLIGSRIPVFIFGALLNAALIITLFLWTPNPDEKYIFFIIAGLWGVCDAVWQTQINALYGVLFNKSDAAAFSNYRLWESLGFVIAYTYANFIPVYAKLAVISACLAVGMAGYLAVEWIIRKEKK